MSRTLWIDARNGIAGDMLLGALLDAGADLGALNEALGPLGARVVTERVMRGPFSALKAHVQDLQGHAAEQHSQAHDHSHHHHAHWSDIRARIGGHPRAIAVFRLLAEAEAAIHGSTVDEVAFHEVGALDSIADIVGVTVLLDQLDITRVVATPPPMGNGTVHTQHGNMTVPAPATLACLLGWSLPKDDRPGELTTPTGAALLAVLGTPGGLPAMTPAASGFGAGTRDPRGWSNTVRVVLGAPSGLADTPLSVVELQAQVDDLPGEWLPPLFERLSDAGALDAFAAPVIMKQGRNGLLLTVLCAPERASSVESALLRHSTTFGVRRRTCERRALERSWETVDTAFGPIRVKLGRMEGELLHCMPEHRDCADAATRHGVSVATVHRAALGAMP